MDREKEKVTNKKEQKTMDGKKVLQANNIIDFHAEAQAELNSNQKRRSRIDNTEIVKGLAQPDRKIDFLNDQLGNTKSELTIFKKNHKSLVEQMLFIQKDFKRRLRNASEEKRKAEDSLKKAIKAVKAKEQELEMNEQKFGDLKEKFNHLHNVYAKKIENFKSQHKLRLSEKEGSLEKKANLLAYEKQKLQQSLDLMLETVRQKSNKASDLENDLRKTREKLLDAEKLAQSLQSYKDQSEISINEMEKSVKKFKAEIEQIQKEKKETEKELSVLQFSYKASQDDADINRRKADDLGQRIVSLKSYIKEKEQKIVNLEQAVTSLRNDNVEASKLSEQIREFKISDAALRNEIQDLNQMRVRHEKKINDQNIELVSFKKKLNQIQDSYQSELAARKVAEEKLAKVESIYSRERNEVFELKSKVADLKKVVEEKARNISNLNSDLDVVEGQNEKLTLECKDLEEHVKSLTHELKSTTEEHHNSLDVINGFNEKVAELSAEILDLKDERDNLNGQIQDLNSEIETERENHHSLEKELAEKMAELENANSKEADFIEAQQSWNDTKEALELRIADFTRIVEEKDQELLSKQDIIEDRIKQIKAVHNDLDAAHRSIRNLEEEKANLIKEKDALTCKSDELKVKKEQLETSFDKKDEEFQKIVSDLDNFENENRALNQKIESLEQAISQSEETYGLKVSNLKDELEQIRKQKIDVEKELEQSEQKALDLEGSLESAKIDIDRVQKESASYLIKIDQLSDQMRLFDEGKQNLVEVIEDKRREIEDLKNQLASESAKAKTLENEVADQDQRIAELEEEAQSRSENGPSKLELKKRADGLKEKQTIFEGEQEKRREELSLYSRWVDSQKESLKKHIVRFSQELKLSLSVNPLKSYLAMTERELEKVNLLLAKPGVVGAQRTHLEEHHKILKDQAGYIAEMVEKNKADVDKRINEVMGLLKQEEFVPVPPLPPKK